MENVSIENIVKGLMILSVIALIVQFLVERVKLFLSIKKCSKYKYIFVALKTGKPIENC